MNPILIKTADGSDTLYLKEIDEHYHSINGAITESEHVFLNSGLLFSGKKALTILEVGFGTGLNCLLTAIKSSEMEKNVIYIAFDNFPLDDEILKNLNYTILLKGSFETFRAILSAPWGSLKKISENFTLGKYCIDVVKNNLPDNFSYDLIYFDAFAPSKQPEIWTTEIFRKISDLTKPGGIIVTYCSKGEVRRKLELVGFNMEKLPGPPGKREILRGIKKILTLKPEK